jgi:glyoxylase-like metal-dependent hydrolase (beta-lactamase superfamily II)
MMPHADPLADYLQSFSRFDDIPDDVLVLPSHGMPYRGIRQRIEQLRSHHARRLGETKRLLAWPRTALDLSRAMFPRVEGANDIGFALGETLAHVNHLVNAGEVEEQRNSEGQSLFGDLRPLLAERGQK